MFKKDKMSYSMQKISRSGLGFKNADWIRNVKTSHEVGIYSLIEKNPLYEHYLME